MNAWSAIGLVVFMYLNWQFVAPKIRVATEQYNSLTFSSFFESRLADTSGLIRLFTALMQLVFYTIYISAGLIAMGLLMESLFDINYYVGILIGIAVVIPYIFFGGFVTLAWIDFFQGLFLMAVIIFVPLYLLPKVGGFHKIDSLMQLKHFSTSLLPDLSGKTITQIFFMLTGFGLGYFGQPHIVTKFMGIKNVSEIVKSKRIGMSWMILSLSAATLIGLVGIAFFQNGLKNPEELFIEIVRSSFPPLAIGFILCAVLAVTINSMSSQILVLSSSLTEDFYKRLFRKNASSPELLLVTRLSVIFVAILSFGIAYGKFSTIYSLVQYAWSGLGASFGPLVLFALYSKKVNKYGAWAGILSGGVISAIWPLFNDIFGISIPTLIPAFFGSCILILSVSYFTRHRHHTDFQSAKSRTDE